MSKSFRKTTRLLAALLTVAMLLVGQCAAAFAATSAGSPVIDFSKTGTLTVLPEYDGKTVAGCAFSIYKVAEIDQTSSLMKYTLNGTFSKAGVDLNAVSSSASTMLAAAKTLAKYADNEKLSAVQLAAGQTKLENLTLGVYLVVQTSAPGKYIAASPFLVYVPVTDAAGSSWLYDLTAQPKLGYNNTEILTVNVAKTWDDAGNEANRPAGVSVTLLRNGSAYGSAVTLNSANNWSYSWKNLDTDYTWSVTEDIPTGYTNLIDSNGPANNVQSFEITNVFEVVPLSDVVTATKVWKDFGHEGSRPQSIKVGLYVKGVLQQTAVLNSLNSWSATWPVAKASDCTVSEIDAPSGYTVEVTNKGSAYTITNTYKEELTPIPDDDVPKSAPQTGLVQWPVPVLLILGALMIVTGYISDWKSKRRHEA